MKFKRENDVTIRCSHTIEEIRQMLLKFKSSKRQQNFEKEICHFAWNSNEKKIGDLHLDQSTFDFLYPLVPLWTAEAPLLPLGFRSSNTLHI